MSLIFIILSISMLTFCSLCLNDSFILSANYLNNSGLNWNTVLCFDYVSLGVLLMLSICFGYASYYTGHYFSGGLDGIKLNYLIVIFVSTMASLTLTGDTFITLIFWEYLGVVSFFLILFYLNYLSLRSSIITLVSSRFGDVCLFFLIAMSVYNNWDYSNFMLICYFLIILTKSAGFPFISWLLEAMRAPTPVSSLVHSSTLVAAGVWFAIRYDMFLFINNGLVYTLFLLLTVFITGICCFFFLDLKKIVALSTCNNISWCILYLIFGDIMLSLFQLVSHGVSKCLLFMLVGDIMSGSGGSQASNCVYSSRFYNSWNIFSLFSIVLGLSGCPFIGVFFTKHFMLSEFSSLYNILLFFFVSLCVFLSYFYSFRLCAILLNSNNSIACGVSYRYNSGILVSLWLMINFFVSIILDESSGIGSNSSLILVLFQLVSIVTAWFFYSNTTLSNWCSSLFGCDNIVEACYNWFVYNVNNTLMFYLRWDNIMLKIFNGYGFFSLNILNFNLLNLTIIGTLIIFSYLYIVY